VPGRNPGWCALVFILMENSIPRRLRTRANGLPPIPAGYHDCSTAALELRFLDQFRCEHPNQDSLSVLRNAQRDQEHEAEVRLAGPRPEWASTFGFRGLKTFASLYKFRFITIRCQAFAINEDPERNPRRDQHSSCRMAMQDRRHINAGAQNRIKEQALIASLP
jgi:hypothetical protein